MLKINFKKNLLIHISMGFALISILIAMLKIPTNTINSISPFFIVGPTLILLIFSFFRNLKRQPLSVQIKENNLELYFYRKEAEIIPVESLTELSIMIHSKKSAKTKFKYITKDNEAKELFFAKANYIGFVDFFKTLSDKVSSDCNINIISLNKSTDKKGFEYKFEEDWDIYLTKRKTIKDVIIDIKNENFKNKIIGIIFFAFVIFRKTRADSMDIDVLIGFLGIAYLLYLVLSFIFRLLGFSREECFQLLIVLIFFGFLGLGSIFINLSDLIKLYIR